MSSIDGVTSSDNYLRPVIDSLPDKSKTGQSSQTSPATPAASAGIKVSISGKGLNEATNRSENSDIEKSGLPANIQTILKMIRELKQQIAQQQDELQAVMSDNSLDAEQMQTKASGLQAIIAGLNGGLMTTYARLNKAIQGAGLSPEQLMKVASLMANF